MTSFCGRGPLPPLRYLLLLNHVEDSGELVATAGVAAAQTALSQYQLHVGQL